MDLEEGDVVLCTVDRIVGTTVFVKIETNGKDIEGSIMFSEIAPGRIRNIRDYVVPKKKIVCKVLRTSANLTELSFRRVNQEERKQVLNEYKQEKSYAQMLKSILGEKQSQKAISKISEKERLYDFFQEAKGNPKILNKIFSKKDSEKILSILKTEKSKEKEIKKEISVTSTNPEGLKQIRNILNPGPKSGIKVKYISGGKYSIQIKSSNLKKADQELQEFLQEIEKKSKKQNMEFSILKK